MHFLRFMLFISFFLLFPGCHWPRIRSHYYQLPQTDLCQQVNRVQQSSAFCEGDIKHYEKWWDFFKDPILSNLIETALACHPDIALADSRIRLAWFEAQKTRSKLLPHLFLFSNIKGERVSKFSSQIPGVFGTFAEAETKLLSSNFELDIWKRNRARYAADIDRIVAREAEFAEVQLILSTAIAAIYFDLKMQTSRFEINKKRLKAREELYEIFEQQYRSNIISKFRIYETDTQVALLKDLLYQIESIIEVDKHALMALVGNLGSGCIELDAPFTAKIEPFPLPCTLPLDLIARRPDITAQKWRISAAGFDFFAAKMKFYPRIDLLAYAGFLSFKIERLFSPETIVALAAATGVLPLFTAGKLEAKLGIAKERVEQEIDMYNNLVLQAVKEVSDALTNLKFSSEREQSLKKAIEDATSLVNLSSERFQNKIADKVPVLDALENLLIQKDLETDILLARYEAAVDLIRAIGGGYYECGCDSGK